jgi:putative flippase GtrA
LKKLIKKLFDIKVFRFIFVGGINTLVGYGSFALFLYLGFYYYLSYVLSYVIGICNSYIWNKYFTFKSKNKSYKEIARFISVYLLSFAIGSLILYIFVDIFNMNEYLAGFINLIFTTAISWIGHNKYSFKETIKENI